MEISCSLLEPWCRGCGDPPGWEFSGNIRGSAILALIRIQTGNKGEYLRVVGILEIVEKRGRYL